MGTSPRRKDPPSVIRAEKGKDITKMLIDGELDAAIYGAAMPDDPRLQSVIANPDAEAKPGIAKHHLVPVNHMVVVTDELVKARPEAVAELYRMLAAGARRGGQPAAASTLRRSARMQIIHVSNC